MLFLNGTHEIKVACSSYNYSTSQYNVGPVTSATFHLDLQPTEAPTFSPAGGRIINESTLVTLKSATPNAQVWYTTDGSVPVPLQSTTYNGPLPIKDFPNGKVKIRAVAAIFVSQTYTVHQTSPASSSHMFQVDLPAGKPPTFSPNGGKYDQVTSVTFSSSGTVFYTIHVVGDPPVMPTSHSPSSCDGCSIEIARNCTILARGGTYQYDAATGNGFFRLSAVATSNLFTLNIPNPSQPTITPNGGTFNTLAGVQVTISSADTNYGSTQIYYTTDGSTPTTNSNAAYGSFTLTTNATVKAIAGYSGITASPISPVATSEPFDITLLPPPVPHFSPNGGKFTNKVAVTFENVTGLTVYYTTDGTTPTSSSGTYSDGTLTLTTNGKFHLKAISFREVYDASGNFVDTQSAVGTSDAFDIDIPAPTKPTFHPDGGTYNGTATVTVNSNSQGLTIFYTTDGSAPVAQSCCSNQKQTTDGTITLVQGGKYKIRAIAAEFDSNSFSYYNPSPVAVSGDFTIIVPPPRKDVITAYHFDKNVVYFHVYRVQNILQYGLLGDNAASPGGEVGFLTEEYGQTTGYIQRFCVAMTVEDHVNQSDFDHGNTDAFQSYACCGGGSCSNCGYTGSGTNTNSNLPGRSYQLDKPTFATQSERWGWWYSFPVAGHCADGQPLGHNGCTYRTAHHVEVIKFKDVEAHPNWTTSQQTPADFYGDVDAMLDTFKNNAVAYIVNDGKFKRAFGAHSTQARTRLLTDPQHNCAVTCPAGFYAPGGVIAVDALASKTCEPCPMNTFAASEGTSKCTPCPLGTSTNSKGATRCSSQPQALAADDSSTSTVGHNNDNDNDKPIPTAAAVAIGAGGMLVVVVAGFLVVSLRRRYHVARRRLPSTRPSVPLASLDSIPI